MLFLIFASICQAVTIPADLRIPTQIIASYAAPPDSPLDMPTDIAIDSTGRIYVADGVNSRVAVFGPDGVFTGAILTAGDTRLPRPLGLFVDAQDRLWITDTELHRVLAVETHGDGWPRQAPLLQTLALPAAPHGNASEPADPTDVVITRDGRQAFVADNDHGRLIAVDLATRAVQLIGHPGRGLGEFAWPFMLALGPDGYIYVCEAIGARVQRINPNGRPAGQIGRWGIEAGQLYRPKGITIDANGTVYVSDSSLGVVQAFRTDGTFLGVLTDATGAPLRFQHPMGMALDGQGRLYVIELTANRIAVLVPGPVRPAQAAIGQPAATRPTTPTQPPTGGQR